MSNFSFKGIPYGIGRIGIQVLYIGSYGLTLHG